MKESQKLAVGLGIGLFLIGAVNALVAGADLTQGVVNQVMAMAPFVVMMLVGFVMVGYGTGNVTRGENDGR